MNRIVAQAAALQKCRYTLTIWPSHNVHASPEEYAKMAAQEEKIYKEYLERMACL